MKYRTYPRTSHEGRYFYMEAVKGEKYSIEVTNRSDRNIGVVIAVDGRNIISGNKSDLKNNERMYIVSPHRQIPLRAGGPVWTGRTGSISLNSPILTRRKSFPMVRPWGLLPLLYTGKNCLQ